ncbi:MAG: DinB family protein [Anaerolineae bacterium]
MPSPQQQAHINKIRELPARLEALLATIPAADLDSRITPDEWCTRQIVHHLADAHSRALMLMKMTLFEDQPRFVPWKQDAFAETADYKLPVEDSLMILRGVHKRIVTLLESLDDAQWQRVGIHPVRGEMTVEAIAALYDGHGDTHIAQIHKTLGRSS